MTEAGYYDVSLNITYIDDYVTERRRNMRHPWHVTDYAPIAPLTSGSIALSAAIPACPPNLVLSDFVPMDHGTRSSQPDIHAPKV